MRTSAPALVAIVVISSVGVLMQVVVVVVVVVVVMAAAVVVVMVLAAAAAAVLVSAVGSGAVPSNVFAAHAGSRWAMLIFVASDHEDECCKVSAGALGSLWGAPGAAWHNELHHMSPTCARAQGLRSFMSVVHALATRKGLPCQLIRVSSD